MSGAKGQCLEVRNEGWKCEFSENVDKQTFCMLADTEKKKIEKLIILNTEALVKGEDQRMLLAAI